MTHKEECDPYNLIFFANGIFTRDVSPLSTCRVTIFSSNLYASWEFSTCISTVVVVVVSFWSRGTAATCGNVLLAFVPIFFTKLIFCNKQFNALVVSHCTCPCCRTSGLFARNKAERWTTRLARKHNVHNQEYSKQNYQGEKYGTYAIRVDTAITITISSQRFEKCDHCDFGSQWWLGKAQGNTICGVFLQFLQLYPGLFTLFKEG